VRQNRSRPDRPSRGRRHFKEGLDLEISIGRISELYRMLRTQGLRRERDFIFDFKNSLKWHTPEYRRILVNLGHTYPATISFKKKSDAVLFRLSWSECASNPVWSKDKIILPRIRRVMPTLIARQIIGVQPMTPPSSLIMAMRASYATPGAPGSTSPSDSSEEVRSGEQGDPVADRTSG
jgi:hypothetical protein